MNKYSYNHITYEECLYILECIDLDDEMSHDDKLDILKLITFSRIFDLDVECVFISEYEYSENIEYKDCSENIEYKECSECRENSEYDENTYTLFFKPIKDTSLPSIYFKIN
jgi:hypothetical protein